MNETSEHQNASLQSVYFSSKNNLVGVIMVLTRWLLLQDSYRKRIPWGQILETNKKEPNKKPNQPHKQQQQQQKTAKQTLVFEFFISLFFHA